MTFSNCFKTIASHKGNYYKSREPHTVHRHLDTLKPLHSILKKLQFAFAFCYFYKELQKWKMINYSSICSDVISISFSNKIPPCYIIKLFYNEKGLKKELLENKNIYGKKWLRLPCRAKQLFQVSLQQTSKCWKHTQGKQAFQNPYLLQKRWCWWHCYNMYEQPHCTD